MFGLADDRGDVAGYTSSYPYTAMLFDETGCSAFLIGPTTAITAAHCIFETFNYDEWELCDDPGSTRLDGEGVPYCVGGAEFKQYRAGVNSTNGVTPWLDWCSITFRTSYVNPDENSTNLEFASLDFAVIDFSCNAAFDSATGWLGMYIASDLEIASQAVWNFGYPALAPCPVLSDGELITEGVPCDLDNFQYTPVTYPGPYDGAEQWGMSQSLVTFGTTSPWVLTSQIDVTAGHSGSSLMMPFNSQWRTIAVTSNNDVPPTNNFFHRFQPNDYELISLATGGRWPNEAGGCELAGPICEGVPASESF